MNKFQTLLASLLTFEEAIVPLFVHNPKSQKVAVGIMVAESAVPAVVAQIQAAFAQPVAQPTPIAPAA